MKKFFQEFKKFITRGNILDMAVGVIVGGAFTAIVTSLTNNIIRPFINWLISIVGGKEGLSSVYTFLSKSYASDGTIDLANSIYIDWGLFVTAILDFFIIAFSVFVIVKIVNTSREQFKEWGEYLEKQTKKEVRQEKRAMRVKAKTEGRPYKEVWAEHIAEKKAVADAKAKQLVEEKAKQELEARKLNPTQEDLLKQIRDLLAEQNRNNDK